MPTGIRPARTRVSQGQYLSNPHSSGFLLPGENTMKIIPLIDQLRDHCPSLVDRVAAGILEAI
jgi:hypothetical protein